MQALFRALLFVAVEVLMASGGSTVLPARAAAPTPAFDHILVIVEENHSYTQIIGNSQAPYINGLASQNGLATKYVATTHPSLPNYLALTGGSTFGITTNCPPASCPVNAPNIGDRIEAAGKTWKGYMEAMPSPCGTSNAGTYGVRHNPFVYYNDIRSDPTRCANHVVPYSNLATDLASASTTPNFVWITPDVCNDMHDCSVSVGDTWLQNNLPAIFSSPAWTTQKSLLLLTWDESGSTNRVPTLVISPSVAPGFQSSTAYNHYSLLKTVESAWGLAPLTSSDVNASPMADFFVGSTVGSISGKVTNAADSSAIQGATVTDSTSSTSTTTDTSGMYTLANLAAGSHSLTASATGFTTSAPQPASVTAGQTTPNVNFALAAAPTTGAVTGTVKTSGGAVIAGATVSDNGGTATTTTGSTGIYTLTGLAPGSHTLTAAAAGYTSGSQPASVNAGQTTQNINFALTAAVGPQLVQSAGASETAAGTTLTATFPVATGAGHLLVLSASLYTGATSQITSITDSGGNTWTKIGAFFVAGHYSDGEMWYAANAKPATSVVIHTTGSVVAAMAVQEFSGVATTSPLDVSTGASNTSTTASSGSVTPTASTDLVVGFVAGHNKNQAISVGAGYTAQAQQTSAAGASTTSVVTGFKVLTSASAETFSSSFTTAMYWAAGIATFKAGP